MEIKLVNADTNPIYVEHQNNVVLLHPGESDSYIFCNRFDFKLMHLKSDTNNPVMYMANALISYKQSRIEFTVDGEYSFEPKEDKALLKVKNYEYVPNKNISYNIFVFNCNPESIKCTKYLLPKRKAVLKKCRLLYLFGGLKTFFPISLLLFIASLFCVFREINFWENILFTIGSGVSTIVLGASYLRSLHVLREYSETSKIRAYMDSQRVEYRTLEDDMMQKNRDNGSKEEQYW